MKKHISVMLTEDGESFQLAEHFYWASVKCFLEKAITKKSKQLTFHKLLRNLYLPVLV